MNKNEPIETRETEIIFEIGKFSPKTNAPARIGKTAPIAALKGIMYKARPRVKAI